MKGSSMSVMGGRAQTNEKWMRFRRFVPSSCVWSSEAHIRKEKKTHSIVGWIEGDYSWSCFVFFCTMFTLFLPHLQKVSWYGFVHHICGASPRVNFARMHYLPQPKLVLSPLPQDLLLFVCVCLCLSVCVCVCVCLIRNWAEYLGRPERFIILMNTIQRGTDTVLG